MTEYTYKFLMVVFPIYNDRITILFSSARHKVFIDYSLIFFLCLVADLCLAVLFSGKDSIEVLLTEHFDNLTILKIHYAFL